MSTKLNYLFIDPNPRAQSTYAAILAVCMECGREKAEKAIRAAAAGATVIFAASAQPYADVIEALAAENGKICRHKTAACYILLRKEVLA